METTELTKQRIRRKIKYYESLLYQKTIDIDLILNEVSKTVNIPVEYFLVKYRNRELVTARQVSMSLARRFTDKPLAVIGELMGGRDHATVLHSIRTIDDLLTTKDPETTRIYNAVFEKLVNIQKEYTYPPTGQENNIFNTEK